MSSVLQYLTDRCFQHPPYLFTLWYIFLIGQWIIDKINDEDSGGGGKEPKEEAPPPAEEGAAEEEA